MDERSLFIQQSGFTKMWALVKKKYISYGIAGTIRLSGLNEDEKEALAGLFAINMRGRTEIRFTLQELDKALSDTKYKLSVAEILTLLYGDEIVRRQEQVEAERQAWERFCKWAAGFAMIAELQVWIERLMQGKAPGYRTFLECYDRFREQGDCKEWINAMNALHRLPLNMERLPVFAAEMTGDAHGLDRDQLTGRLFYWGIAARLKMPFSEETPHFSLDEEVVIGGGSEEIRKHYAKVGIALDDMSSNAMIVGWGPFHQLPVWLPLFSVERLETVLPLIQELYVVENPSIFGSLIDHWDNQDKSVPFPLLCTNGQPSLAALRLMDFAARNHTRIYYSGDFDVKGLEMASLLHKRFGDQFIPWCMDAQSYITVDHPNLLCFSEKEELWLSRMQLAWDEELLKILLVKGKKVFQEHIMKNLLDDWKLKECY
jgi:uncharacterized protein (TIGR02679 family)